MAGREDREMPLSDEVGLWCRQITGETAWAVGRAALFLDRDGVILRPVPYLHRASESVLIEGAAEVIQACNRNEIPVIFLTAYSDNETLQRAKITEPFGYLIKPHKERELNTNIEVSLYRHRMEQRVKEHERWLELLLKSISDGVITVGLDDSVTTMVALIDHL